MNFGSRGFVYGEGVAHREAADLVQQEESCEELAATFALLPFHNEDMDSEEEEPSQGSRSGEGEEGVVVELSQTGPPTRKLKPPIVTIGESVVCDWDVIQRVCVHCIKVTTTRRR